MPTLSPWIQGYVSTDTFTFGIGARVGLPALAAEAELRRRLIVAALAIERFRVRNGVYPEKLSDIPDAPAPMLIDFADGKPLRYRRTDDGQFVLYSAGFDTIDNDGDGSFVTNRSSLISATEMIGPLDLVWPRPAP